MFIVKWSGWSRYKDNKFDLIREKFKPYNAWHCHFSGIEYTDAGERKHLKTPRDSIKELLKNLPKDKEIVIINESPDMVNDSIESIKLSKNLF